MAASKDVFEPQVFAANTFAAGAFRGLGVTVSQPFAPQGQVSVEPRYGGQVSVEPRYAGQVGANQ